MDALIELIKGFVSPKVTYQKIGDNPRTVLYFIWVIVLNAILFLIVSKFVFPIVQSGLLEKAKELPPDLRSKVIESYTYSRFLLFGLLGSLIYIPLKMLIQALIFYILFPLAGGVISWGRSLTAVAFANFVTFIAGVFKLPFIIAFKVESIHTDLSIIYSGEASFLSKLLGQIDIFTLYSLYILAVGLSILGNNDRKKTLVFVYLIWLFYIVIYSLLPLPRGGFLR